ncbi:MAG: TSUP family transporter [Clostridia bacterium]|nr:TSUP family transporter [Clostridia bacterium]
MILGIPLQTLLITVPLVFLSGLMDAIAGGGGLISLPAYLLAGIPAHQAVATNKLSSTMGLTVSTGRYLARGYVDRGLVLPTVILSVTGAAVGARLNLLIPEQVMEYFLVAVLPIIAFVVFKKRSLDETAPKPVSRTRQLTVAAVAALLLGMYDGFYGPGTGTFLLLVLTGPRGLDVRTASGNVKVMNLSSNLGSLIVYLFSGQTIVPLGLISGLAAILGQYIGSGLVIKSGVRIVRPIVLVVLSLLLLRILINLLG